MTNISLSLKIIWRQLRENFCSSVLLFPKHRGVPTEKGRDRGINTSQHMKKEKQLCDFSAEWEAQLHWLKGPICLNWEVWLRLQGDARSLCRQWASLEPHFVCLHFSKMGWWLVGKVIDVAYSIHRLAAYWLFWTQNKCSGEDLGLLLCILESLTFGGGAWILIGWVVFLYSIFIGFCFH